MKKELVTLPEMKLLGMTVRTNNKNEMNPQLAQIGSLIASYDTLNMALEIPNRTYPGITYSVYTDYEGNEHDNYTYFVGEEVSIIETIPKGFTPLIILAGQYQKFTTKPGPMPTVVIQAWQEIWGMSANDLGGKRRFLADFEVYDQRASDPTNAIVDIYIGIV